MCLVTTERSVPWVKNDPNGHSSIKRSDLCSVDVAKLLMSSARESVPNFSTVAYHVAA